MNVSCSCFLQTNTVHISLLDAGVVSAQCNYITDNDLLAIFMSGLIEARTWVSSELACFEILVPRKLPHFSRCDERATQGYLKLHLEQ